MKLNNKGFAISSIMYIILVLAVILISLILVTLSSRKLILDKLKDEVLTTIYEAPNITYRQTINELKNETIAYMTINSLEKDSIKVENLDSSIDSEVLEKYKLNDKYLTAVQNDTSYDVYLGKTSTITDTTELPKNTIDIVDYKIYGNSYQETSVQAKNLFDGLWEPGSLNTYTGEESPETASLRTLNYIKLEPNKSYYVTLPKGNNYFPILYKSDKSFSRYIGLKVQSFSFSTSEEEYYLRIMQYNNSTIPENVQIEEGTAATPYEEFIPNKPSPEYPSEIESVGNLITDETDENYNKYKISVKTSSKNLFNLNILSSQYYKTDNDKVTIVSINNREWNELEKLYLKPNTTYTLLLENLTNVDVRTPDYNVKLFSNTSTNKATFTTDNTGQTCFKFFCNDAYPCEIGTIQLEEGTVTTDYEPYVAPITTNIYLNEPLRKIEDYVDYIDFANKKLFKNVEVVDETGTLTLKESLQGLAITTEESIELPKINANLGITQISIDTNIEPSNYEFTVIEKIIQI